MQCKQVHDHLSAYLDRELTAELSSAVRHHLASCPECRAMLEELRATADLLGRLPVREAPAGLADDVRSEIERRMLAPEADEDASMPERTLAAHRARAWPRVLAVAACVALAAGIGLVAFFGSRSLEQPAASGPELARYEPREPADGAAPLGRAARRKKGAPEDADPTAPAETGLRGVGKAPEGEAREAPKPEAEGRETSEAYAFAEAEPPPAKSVPKVMEKAATPDEDALAKVAPKAVDELGTEDAGTHANVPDHRMAKTGPREIGEALAEKSAHRSESAAPEAADPQFVQRTMNTVAAGEAPVGSLRRVATPRTLDRASNQLVVRAPSRASANRDLVRLFVRNGWRELDERAEWDRARQTAPTGRPAVPGKDAGGGGVEGLYYLAHRDGEDLWVVVTTADDLSRFATQVAQSRTIQVAAESSRPFQAVRRLQKQLAAFEAETFARGGGAVADDKEALRAGAAVDTRSGVRQTGSAGDADSPARKAGPPGGPAKRASLTGDLPAERETQEPTRRRGLGDGGGRAGTGRPVNGQAAEPPPPQTAAAPDETPPAKKAEAEGEGLERERAEETTGATGRKGLGRQGEAQSAIPPNQVMLVVRVRSADEPPRAAEDAEAQVETAEETKPAEAEQRPAPADQE